MQKLFGCALFNYGGTVNAAVRLGESTRHLYYLKKYMKTAKFFYQKSVKKIPNSVLYYLFITYPHNGDIYGFDKPIKPDIFVVLSFDNI